jgi:hypothetical protein
MYQRIAITIAMTVAFAAALTIAGPVLAQSDTGTVVLQPGATFSAAANLQTPLAQTFLGDPDLWTFDLSAPSFASGAQIGLTIGDSFNSDADAYKVYWDGVLLGSTPTGGSASFNLATTQGLHDLKVEWLTVGNPGTVGEGSFYNLSVVAQVPEPQTAALTLLGLALLGAYVRRRRDA